MNVDDLLRRWKKDLDEHVDNYGKLAKDLVTHENEISLNYETVSTSLKLLLNTMFQILELGHMVGEMERDFSGIEFSLNGIAKQQVRFMTSYKSTSNYFIGGVIQ